jgi:hypothetical protein
MPKLIKETFSDLDKLLANISIVLAEGSKQYK